MIRINKQARIREKQREAMIRGKKQKEIRDSLESIGYNLDDRRVIFRINQFFKNQERFIGVQVYAKPIVGMFANIEFRVIIFFKFYSDFYGNQPPKVYNDRRVFHPNINIEDCEIVMPQLSQSWNPSNDSRHIFDSIKKVLIQPCLECVPNTKFNRRAAFFYKMRQQNFRQQMLRYSPKFLQDYFEKYQQQQALQQKNRMIDEADEENSKNQRLFNINILFQPKKHNFYERQEHEWLPQELTKSIKRVDFYIGSYLQSSMHCNRGNSNRKTSNEFLMEQENTNEEKEETEIQRNLQKIYF